MSPSPLWRRLGALVFVAVLLCAPAAFADGNAPARADGFEAVDGNMMAPGESIPGNKLLGAAYGFILAALVLYIGSVTARTDQVEQEIEELRRRIAHTDRKAAG